MDALQSIVAYSKGELTGNALQKFEERLKSDTAFAEEVADYQRLKSIDKYLNKTLEGKALEEFKATLANDSAFAEEVAEYEQFWQLEQEENIGGDSNDVSQEELEEYHKLTDNLQFLGKQLELKETLEEITAFYKNDGETSPLNVSHSVEAPNSSNSIHPPKKNINRRLWIFSTALAAMLAGLIFLPQFLAPPNPTSIYANYIAEEKASFGTKGVGDDLLLEGEKAFNDKNYRKAIQAFDSYLRVDSTGKNVYKVKIYKGIAHLEENEFDEAIELFESLRTGDQNWYLALAYLKQDNVEEAKKYLQKLVNVPSNHATEAKKLLKKL